MQAKKSTDVVLIENVDCRILFTEQHQLGIDVGGYVIVRDPVEWHRVMKQSRGLTSAAKEFLLNPSSQRSEQSLRKALEDNE